MTQSIRKEVLVFLFFALIHELIHLVFILMLSVPPKKISLSIFGADIKREIITSNSYNAEILINLSAPVFNLLLAIIFYTISKVSPAHKNILTTFGSTNLILGIFNLMPYYNFDGGNALHCFLFKHLNEQYADNISVAISVIITILFSFFTVYLFVEHKHNFSLLPICFYMIFCIIFKK